MQRGNEQLKELLKNTEEECKRFKEMNVKLQASFDDVNEKLKLQEDYKCALEGKVKIIKAKQVEIDQLKKLLAQEEECRNMKINDFLDKISYLNDELNAIQKINDELYRENSGKF